MSSTSPNPVTRPTPQPRIDLHIQVARNALRGGRFRKYFCYEGPPDTEAQPMQEIMEELFDNPVMMEMPEGKIVRAPPEEQPGVVVHRMYWQGESEEEQVVKAEVLTEALGKMLVSLSIDFLSVGLQDVAALLVSTWTLESLEIRDVVPDNEAGEHILPVPRGAQSNTQTPANNLSSLTITSHAALDNLFEQVSFPGLTSLSLRLPGDASLTSFKNLLSSSFKKFEGREGEEGPTFKLRCRLSPAAKRTLDDTLERKGVRLDHENL